MSTVNTSVFVQDGQYLSFINGEGNDSITLGQVVMLDTGNAGYVKIATAAGKADAFGVAAHAETTADLIGNSSMNAKVPVGGYLTVITKGIVNVTCSGEVAIGAAVEAANDGKVAAGSTNTIGTALEAGNNSVIKIQLLRKW